ncbi:hypothetical protein [Tepidiforma sp.]|jgi:hypothetical protein|uniref:hypothetical protein n=1 Tax=Tepidiforma sp. TaxID=2682230 RepID=UPI002606D684|nr:hypothetical protein [Tepidiforma sp.]MCX7616843.1 hypothetical protein [Tepidiforma sp.]
MSVCAICQAEGQPPRHVTNPVGLLTSRFDILATATHRYGDIDGETHALVPVCPEHVVDVYRGRIPGVRMAWRLGPNDEPGATGVRAGRAAGSASRA